jgi:hypothetical protein
MMCAGGAIIMAAAWYGTRLVRKILAPMKDGLPFSEGVSANLKKLGWYSIACGVLFNVLDLIGKGMLAKALIASSAAGPVSYSVQHNIDLTFILTAFVFFLCSYIIRYGEELQRLSDETV